MPNSRSQRFYSVCFLKCCSLVLKFRSKIDFQLFFCMLWSRTLSSFFFFFPCGYPIVPVSFTENTFLPIELPWHICLKSIYHECKGFISGVSILFHWSLCLSLCWQPYSSFVVKFEVRLSKSSNLVLLPLNDFGHSTSSEFPHTACYFLKEKILLGIQWGSCTFVDQFSIMTILSVPIHKYCKSFHLFGLCLISLSNSL